MNREERRRKMKENPEYRRRIEASVAIAMNNLERMMKKYWKKNDQTLNEGAINEDEDNDEGLNY